jgi:LacI family transcriptional regulator
MAGNSKRATQWDVARNAGVSQATVSLVLGGAPSPTKATSARVLEIARELGYAPNRWAQALRTRRTKTLGVVVPDICNPFFPSLLKGVQSVADAAGYDVIAINTEGDEEREQRILRWGVEGRVDGIIGRRGGDPFSPGSRSSPDRNDRRVGRPAGRTRGGLSDGVDRARA